MAALNVRRVVYGDLEFVPWYPSLGYFDPSHSPTKRYVGGLPKCILTDDGQMPYPAIETLYVCSGCFKYSIRSQDIAGHGFHCKTKRTPPGRLIFRSDKYAIRRLSGALHSTYCQCLCLFAKLFLDSKSLYFALDGFEFFVLYDVESSIPLGFFSREKNSWDKYNLACILVFPPFQGLGLGQLLIGFSYELSKSENQIGSPEKPLSMYGHKSYLAYWTKTIARILLTYKQKVVSIKELSKESAIRPEDIEEALKSMNALQYDKNNNPLISLLKVNQWATSINLSLDPVIDPSCCYIPPLENNKSS